MIDAPGLPLCAARILAALSGKPSDLQTADQFRTAPFRATHENGLTTSTGRVEMRGIRIRPDVAMASWICYHAFIHSKNRNVELGMPLNMPDSQPPRISPDELRRRWQRVEKIARSLGFVGRVEYRHVISSTGGAQFGLAARADSDLLLVDALAFERDANPEDFSLEAMIAHERGHQLLHRHPRLRGFTARWSAISSEELMASIVGSFLVVAIADREKLLLKAIGDAVKCGIELDDAVWLVTELRFKMEELL